jgi:threonine aldolase
MIDVRSDTVTQPTDEMRNAMRDARVGDDFYGLDPTVEELESLSAGLLGKEAALFTASGTMANATALLCHTQRGDSVLLDPDAHMYRNETGHLAVVSGVLPILVAAHAGIPDAEAMAAAINEGDVLGPTSSLIWVENTHNAAGGTCTDPDTMSRLRVVADRFNMRIHVDGERLFNAAIALGVDAAELVRDADSVQFGLTKGLAAPFGSVLVGDRTLIRRARKHRQMLGGGMRQAGFMAAAGIVALRTMRDRLAEDHAHAQRLAAGLLRHGLEIDMSAVQTNIVYFDVPTALMPATDFVEALAAAGIAVNPPARGSQRLRMVTHFGIGADDIEAILDAVSGIVCTAA